MSIETVTVKNGDGQMIINKSDYDKEKHQIIGDDQKSKRGRKAKLEDLTDD